MHALLSRAYLKVSYSFLAYPLSKISLIGWASVDKRCLYFPHLGTRAPHAGMPSSVAKQGSRDSLSLSGLFMSYANSD